jgi:hypothetical protein
VDVPASGGSDERNAALRTTLQELASPFQQACAEIGGSASHYALTSDAALRTAQPGRRRHSQEAVDVLIGQHSCEVVGQSVFAFGIAPRPNEKTTGPLAGSKLHVHLWTFGPRDLLSARAKARADVH